jgi:hypothetical protein
VQLKGGGIVYKLHIQNETVRMNVALVVETIRHQRPLPEQHQKTLEFSLDSKTGELKTPSQGKSIEIHLDLDKHQVHVTGRQFNLEEMDPKGRQVIAETCQALKSALMHLHDIHEFAHLEFDPSVQEIKGRNLLHDAWHAVERQDAELMLLNSTIGTFLFRKDRFAGVMEEIFSAAKKSSIRCYTLTYLDQTGQVRDRTIVAWKDHWLFYDDDPTLSGQSFSSLEELLSSMGTALKRPLPALRSSKSI